MSENNQPETQELLPCPFCGGSAGDVALRRGHGFIVGCDNCQGQQFAMSREEAVALWNTRSPAISETPTLSPVPTEHEAETKKIVDAFAAEIRRDGFKGQMYEAIESLMDERDEDRDDSALDELQQLMTPLVSPSLARAHQAGMEQAAGIAERKESEYAVEAKTAERVSSVYADLWALRARTSSAIAAEIRAAAKEEK